MHSFGEDEVDQFSNKIQNFIAIIKQENLNPNILEFQSQLFESIKKELSSKKLELKEYIQELDEQADLKDRNFLYSIYNAEIEKISYLLKFYLKIRIKKIQLYCFYLIKNPSIAEKVLANFEYNYLRKYAELRYECFKDNVLSKFNKNFRDFNELELYFQKKEDDRKQKKVYVDTKQSKIDLISPNLNKYCFIRIIKNLEAQLRFNVDITAENVSKEQSEIMSQGTILFCPYNLIATKLKAGDFELL